MIKAICFVDGTSQDERGHNSFLLSLSHDFSIIYSLLRTILTDKLLVLDLLPL